MKKTKELRIELRADFGDDMVFSFKSGMDVDDVGGAPLPHILEGVERVRARCISHLIEVAKKLGMTVAMTPNLELAAHAKTSELPDPKKGDN